MVKMMFTVKARQLYRRILTKRCRHYRPEYLANSAIVFSPHYDDEVLGCGGIVLKKKQMGAEVRLVFMTDGSKSHRHLISEGELKVIRKSESVECAKALGLCPESVVHLGFEETKLVLAKESAINQVGKILNEHRPEEIFIPYAREPLLWSEDHLATTTIVTQALQNYSNRLTVYEYPVWFWLHWPWVNVSCRPKPLKTTILKNTFTYGIGLRYFRDFNCCFYIGGLLDLKYSALQQYKSQMSRMLPDTQWPILEDVANGDFLKCFFQEYEFFRSYPHLAT